MLFSAFSAHSAVELRKSYSILLGFHIFIQPAD